MTYYLGPLGALTALQDPEAALPMTPERIGGSHQLLSGAKVRDTIGYSRSWQLSWTAITLAQYAQLEGFYYGYTGAGPFYFVDDEQTNLVPLNVSTGTDTTKDTTGFTPRLGLGVASSTNANANWNGIGGPFPLIGTRTLATGVATGTAAGSILWEVTAPFTPVVPGLPYTFSTYFSLDAAAITAALQIQVRLDLYDATGTLVTAGITGNSVTTSGGRSTVTTTPGATIAQAKLSARTATANASGATGFVYSDGVQFEQAAAASAWVPGFGMPLVTVESLTRSTPLAGICDAQMTLVQVG